MTSIDATGTGNKPSAGDRQSILTGTKPETIRLLSAAIDGRILPNTFVTGGRIVHVETVSGSATHTSTGDVDAPLPLVATPVTPPKLAALLADNTYCHKYVLRTFDKVKKSVEEEITPPVDVLAAVLSRSEWPGVDPLYGIVGAPVLREDGTLLQTPGYDDRTGLWLAPKVDLKPVPAEPTIAQIAAARQFIFNEFLGDFPWVTNADKANYIGLMVTPILRRYTRSLSPFGLVTSTMPGSGKTILTAGVGLLYGQKVLTWTHSDEELRKAITSVLAEQVGAVVFDNLAEGATINSAVLAQLMTQSIWSDRKLGSTSTLTYPNDRVWLATGNNISVGADMPTRTVLVGLDPKNPNPELRTGFTIPDLDRWILEPKNQRILLHHLLVLVVAWCNAGAPKATGLVMRQFTPWAQNIGGFLKFHRVDGFLGNTDAVKAIDEDNAEWSAFLAKWSTMPDLKEWTKTSELRASTERHRDIDGHRAPDRWDGAFIVDESGRVPDVRALGKLLRGQVGRWHDEYVLRHYADPHDKMARWSVEKRGESA